MNMQPDLFGKTLFIVLPVLFIFTLCQKDFMMGDPRGLGISISHSLFILYQFWYLK